MVSREHGADYAQGYFFARPAAPPPSLVNAHIDAHAEVVAVAGGAECVAGDD